MIFVFAQCSVVITILFVGLFFPHLQPQQVANPHLVDVVCGATTTGVRRRHSRSRETVEENKERRTSQT